MSDRVRWTSIPIRGTQAIEIFVASAGGALFEVWSAVRIKDKPLLVDHYTTHDDLETRLFYARQRDLIWHPLRPDGVPSERLNRRAGHGESMGGRPFDSDFLRYHLVVPLQSLPIDRRGSDLAKRSLLSMWEHENLTLEFAADGALRFVTAPPAGHFASPVAGEAPFSSWRFRDWQLALQRQDQSGLVLPVLRLDETELHVARTDGDTNGVVHVLRRRVNR